MALDTQQLQSRGQPFMLNPGMQVVAEIRQGERTVMEYLLSPVAVTVMSAGRERSEANGAQERWPTGN